jgi:peptide/nickel transport system substrate-binding protein
VVFTYNFITNPDVKSTSRESYKLVSGVEAIDDYTVKVTFKDVDPSWYLPFVGFKGMIIPEHVFAQYNNANAATAPAKMEPVGTGPYIAKEFRTEDVLLIGEDVVNTVKIIYEPNPLYREASKLSFKHVVLQGGGDATVAARAVLQDGIVDYAWNLQVEDKTLAEMEAKGNGKGKVMPLFGSYVERVMINFTDPNKETAEGERSSREFPHPFLTDLQVRRALALRCRPRQHRRPLRPHRPSYCQYPRLTLLICLERHQLQVRSRRGSRSVGPGRLEGQRR